MICETITREGLESLLNWQRELVKRNYDQLEKTRLEYSTAIANMRYSMKVLLDMEADLAELNQTEETAQ